MSPPSGRLASALLGSEPGQTSKPIEDVEVGDLVWAWDEAKAVLTKRPVSRLFRHQAKPVLEVVCVSGDGARQSIWATTEHPFWVEDKGWVAAGELAIGDLLKRIEGSEPTCIREVKKSGRTADVFNFEVDGVHNYFVGEPGVLVHNASDRTIVGVDPSNALENDLLPDTVRPSHIEPVPTALNPGQLRAARHGVERIGAANSPEASTRTPYEDSPLRRVIDDVIQRLHSEVPQKWIMGSPNFGPELDGFDPELLSYYKSGMSALQSQPHELISFIGAMMHEVGEASHLAGHDRLQPTIYCDTIARWAALEGWGELGSMDLGEYKIVNGELRAGFTPSLDFNKQISRGQLLLDPMASFDEHGYAGHPLQSLFAFFGTGKGPAVYREIARNFIESPPGARREAWDPMFESAPWVANGTSPEFVGGMVKEFPWDIETITNALGVTGLAWYP